MYTPRLRKKRLYTSLPQKEGRKIPEGYLGGRNLRLNLEESLRETIVPLLKGQRVTPATQYMTKGGWGVANHGGTPREWATKFNSGRECQYNP